MSGLEGSFVTSWEGWDEVGSAGDLCFYNCKLANHIKGIEPDGTDDITLTILMSESTAQFDFYKLGEFLGSVAYKIKAVLEERIPVDE